MARLLTQAGRLAIHCCAGRHEAIGSALLPSVCFWSSAANDPHDTPSAPADAETTDSGQRHMPTLRYLLQRPLDMAQKAATLATLAATYRDLYVAVDLVHQQRVLRIPDPLLGSSSREMLVPPPKPEQEKSDTDKPELNLRPRAHPYVHNYPLLDYTGVHQEDAGLKLQEKYMDKIEAFRQLLPNHVEVSYQLHGGIFLWPPLEAYYPEYIDFDAALKYLRRFSNRRRVGRKRKRIRK